MRIGRIISTTGLYHVVSRGVNKQNLFYEDSDKKLFISLLEKYKEKYFIEIHASVLMDNHIHLLINDPMQQVSRFMQIVESVYARAFNKKYDRVGHLFQNRFISEPILDEKYYKIVFRYILQNPKKAGMCNTLNYKWSSYKFYKSQSKLISNGIPEKYFGSLEKMYQFVNEYTEDECIDIELRRSEKLNYQIDKIKRLLKTNNPIIQPNLPLQDIKEKIRILKNEGFSIRTIARITGIVTWIVAKA